MTSLHSNPIQRILMTTDCIGGVWTYAMELCRGLLNSQVHIILVTMGKLPSLHQREEVMALPHVVMIESNFKLEWMDDPWEDLNQAGKWLLEIERKYRPDIIHLNGYVHAALPWGAPVLLVAHSCVLSWWQAVKKENAPTTWDRYASAVTKGISSADVVVAPTKAMLNAAHHHYGLPRQGRVIPNSRESSHFDFRREKGPIVMAVGRLWDEAKNIRALVEAAPRLSWEVCVAGEATSPSGQSVDLPNVNVAGVCSPQSVAVLLSKASIFALPACYEPFGLSALEAALSGCALVLGDIPSFREVWADTALYVDPDDTYQISAKIQRLIDNPAERRNLGAAARDRALSYSVGRMTSGYLEVYEDLAKQPTRSRKHLATTP